MSGQSVPPPVTRPTPASGGWTSAWSLERVDVDDTMVALSEAFVFLAGPDSPLEARALGDGRRAWTHPLPSWQALAASDALVLGVSDEHAYALDAATGRTRWVTTTTGANTRLVVEGSQVLLASESDLLLRDLQTGTPLWRAGLTAAPSAPVAVFGDVVVAATADRLLTAFDRSTGAPRWQSPLANPVEILAVGESGVYAGLPNGTLCAYGVQGGNERWCFPLRVPFAGPPVIDGDQVRVALLDNSLRTFDQQRGSMRQPLSLGHRPAAGPWLTPTAVVTALTTGELVVVDRQSGRIAARLPVPDGSGSQRLDRAAIGAGGRAIASLTVGTSGQRRVWLYRLLPSRSLPLMAAPPALPVPGVDLPLAGVNGARPPSNAPRPFPSPR